MSTDLRYPIGRFSYAGPNRAEWLEQLASLPTEMKAAVAGLTDAQLDTPYREGGWTLRQVVHHTADSHMNSYVRFRLALTEQEPTISTYEEQLWAEFDDAKAEPVETSLQLIELLHRRWVRMLRTLDDAAWQKAFIHPANGRTELNKALGLYAWHGRHHVAHITFLRERMGW
ncbi:MAG: bacillithiol transferase BstA [Acidobacteria bacterium]|nr:bacillithiol transferase BstA [Acidobacteriota bacterium]